MKAEELRIGNWVSYKTLDANDNWGVKYAQIEAEDIPRMCYSGNIYEPIPLTEERLKKFGFKKINHIHYGIIWVHSLIKLTWFPNGTIELRGSAGWQKILYVHQLQNLYFALTGEELETKTEE